jgi:Heterokaryon incompatibility protein (HET)
MGCVSSSTMNHDDSRTGVASNPLPMDAASPSTLPLPDHPVSPLKTAGVPPTEASAAHHLLTDHGLASSAIFLKSCRACSDRFVYELDSGGTVSIICGVPRNMEYKAISHVWGQRSRTTMKCSGCKAEIHVLIPASKFDHLMALAGSDSTIWLDVLSIDQTDHNDITSQVSVMGDIFGNASCVAVLLPPSDQEAYATLMSIADMARTIVGWSVHFQTNNEDPPSLESDNNSAVSMGKLCQEFYSKIAQFERDLHSWVYWRRAWTFQEWALARDLEIGWDGPTPDGTVKGVKSAIVVAALTMAQYKLKYGQYANINLGFSRGEVTKRFDIVKRLFPYEDLLLSYEEVNLKDLELQTFMPSLGTNQLLGILSEPRTDVAAQLRARLSIMLNAFGTSKREASLEADLVCCWASMCNIQYDYRRDDTFAIALQKVVIALRQRGITILNFLVNTDGACAEVDLRFLEYSAAHPQCNAGNRAPFLGAPIFTGRTDTAIHLLNAVTQQKALTPLTGSGVTLHKVEGAQVKSLTQFDNKAKVADHFRKATSGMVDGFMLTDVVDCVVEVLAGVPREQLSRCTLAIASLPAIGGNNLSAWAVCPSDVPLKDLFVAREDLNGTLVLALKRRKSVHVVAYLTVTDQQSGTFLIRTDEDGQVDLLLKTPQRSDYICSALLGDRNLRVQVKVEKDSMLAFGQAAGADK